MYFYCISSIKFSDRSKFNFYFFLFHLETQIFECPLIHYFFSFPFSFFISQDIFTLHAIIERGRSFSDLGVLSISATYATAENDRLAEIDEMTFPTSCLIFMHLIENLPLKKYKFYFRSSSKSNYVALIYTS